VHVCVHLNPIAFSFLFLIFLISSLIDNMAPTAHWTAKEELALVDFLIVHQAEASDGANFKVVTFQKAAKHLTPMLERGATKNVKSRENKYCAVCHISNYLFPL
jgi:hypothetical protein